MFWLGVPIVNNFDLTWQLIESIAETASDPTQIEIVIFDNGSDDLRPGWLKLASFYNRIKLRVARSETNRGYYRPITDLSALATHADILGLCHNDLCFYEKGWDRRLRECFVRDGRLGMVGLCGSSEVDDRGGRGGGTMCNFRGERGARTEHTGRRITDLQPALILDSLFIAMRQPVVRCLQVDDNIALNHFGDRVWPLRAIENEWRVGILGIEVDHMGGQTLVGIPRIEEDSRKWCNDHSIPIPEGLQAGTAVYLESERRYLTEFRDEKHLIPAHMNGWQIKPLNYR